ncbi:hypothetical protein Rsub_12000 [Raphidocelis subcapitata]|uniref:Reverse transcriptase domain-containing protein n=1 Tax=Raphidocelis subcapitata TaxID=307507 RepID=A0A2V0PPE6_9CHLO|nr:hypothetical protein Rsub_12000 [Raphidocelis subcapitata]|eukprot:GBF99055.1 hypothetical protein Rsub_12000 [Raphidocelis subcapitata]
MGFGTKHRLTPTGNVFDADTAAEMKAAIDLAIADYVRMWDIRLSNAGGMQSYGDSIKAALHQAVDAIPDGTPVDTRLLRADPSTSFPPVARRLRTTAALVQKEFVFSQVDKAAQNFAIYCRPYYVSVIALDLANPSVYRSLPGLPGQSGPEVEQATIDTIASGLQALGFPPGSRHLPLYTLLAKFHKQPAGARFLASAADVITTPLAGHVNALLSVTDAAVGHMWRLELRGIQGIRLHDTRPWHVSSTTAAVQVLRSFSDVYMPWDQFACTGGMQTFDFARLYTSLPLTLLKFKLAEVLGDVFAAEGATWVQTSPKNDFRSAWFGAHQPPSHTGLLPDGSFVWDLQTATSAVHFLLDNSYVMFGGRVFWQKQGIPMGTNPAVHIANLFLYQFEREFVRQLATQARLATHSLTVEQVAGKAADFFAQHPHRPGLQPWAALHILRSMHFSIRYVDDIITFANPYLPALAYTNSSWMGFTGIYPPQLDLQPAREVPQLHLVLLSRYPGSSPQSSHARVHCL